MRNSEAVDATRGGDMLGKAIAVVVAVPLLYVGLMMGASEFAEEVVVLHTEDEDGRHQRTSLWVVEDEFGTAWLRAGSPDSGWLQRIQSNPEVELERDGRRLRFTAVPVVDPEQRRRLDAMMAARYGLSDTIINALRDGSGAVPVRLEER